MRRPPYYTNYSRSRLLIHNVVTSKYFDLAIAAVIGLNVVTMAMEFYLMPPVSYLVLNCQRNNSLIVDLHNELGTGVGVAHFQLFLHGRLHPRGGNENCSSGLWPIPQRQVRIRRSILQNWFCLNTTYGYIFDALLEGLSAFVPAHLLCSTRITSNCCCKLAGTNSNHASKLSFNFTAVV